MGAPAHRHAGTILALIAILALAAIYLLVYTVESRSAVGLAQAVAHASPEYKVLIFLLLFLIVALPFAWGYLILNIATGYVYGFWTGICVVATGGAMGLCLSTWLCQAICHEWIDAKVNSNEHLRSVRRVLSTKQAYKLVLLTRLTPIPFGLQNAVFALTPLEWGKYTAYSVVGLLPTQVLNTYIGSTLNSIEEVISGGDMDLTTYMGYAAQCVAGVVLTVAVLYKARTELHLATREVLQQDPQADNQTI